MVIGLISAIVAGPAIFGTTEGIRVGQSNNKRDEHRGRRCNLLVNCVDQTEHSQKLNARQVVLQNDKLYICVKDGPSHPLEGYYVPYPDSTDEGFVTSIDDRQPPMLNWVYVDLETFEVKFGVRAKAQPNMTTPFDCTKYEKRLTLDGWEGFVALQEQPGVWALYFDREHDTLAAKAAGREVQRVQLIRSERREAHVHVEATRAQQMERQKIDERQKSLFLHRTGNISFENFHGQRQGRSKAQYDLADKVQITFDPPFEKTPSVALGFTGWETDPTKGQRLQLTAKNVTADGFEAQLSQWYTSTIYSATASWFATVDPDIQLGIFETSEVRPYTKATQQTQKRLEFDKPFNEPPTVFCWFNFLDLAAGTRYHAYTNAAVIDHTGFTVKVHGSEDTHVANAGCYWIALPKNKSGIATGMSDPPFVSTERPEVIEEVRFQNDSFEAPPGRVKMGLSTINITNKAQHKFGGEVHSITARGFKTRNFAQPSAYSGWRMHYIALE